MRVGKTERDTQGTRWRLGSVQSQKIFFAVKTVQDGYYRPPRGTTLKVWVVRPVSLSVTLRSLGPFPRP